MTSVFKVLKLMLGLVFVMAYISLEAQISTFPHRNTFENEGLCVPSCNIVCQLLGTWQNEYSEDNDWLNDRSNTPTGSTGPSNDHTYGNSTGRFLYLESSCLNRGYPNKRSDLVSAYFDFSNVTDTLVFSFWYHLWGADQGTMHLDADTSQGQGPWLTDIIPAWADNLNTWQRKVVDLQDFLALDSVRFRFRGVTGTGYYSDMALDDLDFFAPISDDLEVVAFPAMRDGCGLSNADSIRCTVFNHGTNQLLPGDSLRLSFQLDLNPIVTEDFVLLDTLAPGQQLDFVFQQTADFSALGSHILQGWTQMSPLGTSHNQIKSITIENLAVVGLFPYFEEWETGPANWQIKGTNASWALGLPAKSIINGAAGGQNAWVTGGLTGQYNQGENSWLLAPCFDFSNLCRPVLRMDIAWECESTYDGAVIQVSTNRGLSWSRIGNNNDPYNWYNSSDIYIRPGGQAHGWTGTSADSLGSGGWVEAKRALTGYAGDPEVMLRLVFASDQGVNDEGFGLDNFSIYDGVYLGKDFSFCLGDTAWLDADSVAGDQFLWSTGASSRNIAVTSPGTYWVEVSNNSFCTTRDTIAVTGISSGFSLSLGNPVSVCGQAELDAGLWPGFTYQWSDGQSGQVIVVDSSGDYWLDAMTPCGLVRSDTLNVTILPLPQLELGPDTTGCSAIVLQADPGASSYLWSNGDSSQNLLVNTSGTWSVTSTASNGCTSEDSITVFLAGFPVADLGPDSVLCPGDTICFQANPDPGLAYSWTTGASSNGICVTSGGVYAVTVTNPSGCSSFDTLIVEQPQNPAANISADTSNCPLINFFGFTTGGPGDQYWWDFGDGDTSFQQNPSHVFPAAALYQITLVISNACGMDTTQILLPLSCEVGLAEAAQLSVAVFPNPTSGRLNLKFLNFAGSEATCSLFDLLGKPVLERQFRGLTGNPDRSLDLNGHAKGIYLLEVKTSKGIFRRKIVLR